MLQRSILCLICHISPLYFGPWCSAAICRFTWRQTNPPVLEIHMLTAEQFAAAQKANVETLFGLTNKAFEGVEKLVELNLQVAKAALGEAAETTRAALSVKDAQELLALQAGLLQPTAEKAAAYSRHLYDIAAATNAEVSKVAEQTAAEAQAKFMNVVDTAVKNAEAQKFPGATQLYMTGIHPGAQSFVGNSVTAAGNPQANETTATQAHLGVTNNQGVPEQYRVQLLRKNKVTNTWNFTLANNQTWQVTIAYTVANNYKILANLYMLPNVKTRYRWVDNGQ